MRGGWTSGVEFAVSQPQAGGANSKAKAAPLPSRKRLVSRVEFAVSQPQAGAANSKAKAAPLPKRPALATIASSLRSSQ